MKDDEQREAGVQAARERVEAYEKSILAAIADHTMQLRASSLMTPGGGNGVSDGPVTPADGGKIAVTPDSSCKFFSGLVLPRKPWMAECEFYMKTGTCKYGPECRFDHPPRLEVEMNELGYPLRPGEPLCNHFSKTLRCKYGAACRFHHPMPDGSRGGDGDHANANANITQTPRPGSGGAGRTCKPRLESGPEGRGDSAASWRRVGENVQDVQDVQDVQNGQATAGNANHAAADAPQPVEPTPTRPLRPPPGFA